MARIPLKQKFSGVIHNSLAGIYLVYCLINGYFYIGKSDNIYKRQEQHFLLARYGKHSSKELSTDYKEHGYFNFVHVFLENDQDPYYFGELEKYLIAELNPHYNTQHKTGEQKQIELDLLIGMARHLINQFDDSYIPKEILDLPKGVEFDFVKIYRRLKVVKSYKWSKKRLYKALLKKNLIVNKDKIKLI